MDVLQAIEERRSINFFDPARAVPEDLLKKLLETANLAPSSFNLQPWKVVVVRDPQCKKALRKCAFDQPKAEEASVMLIMVADPSSVEENIDAVLASWVTLGYMPAEEAERMKGMAGNLYGPPDSMKRNYFAVKNTALYAMNLMIAAKGLGLDTHPMDGFKESCVKKEFGIPEDKLIPMLIAVGYLKQGSALKPRAFRRSIDAFVRHERY